jgi:hypothetical protein
MGPLSCLGDGSTELCSEQGQWVDSVPRLGFIYGQTKALNQATCTFWAASIKTASSSGPRSPWRALKFARFAGGPRYRDVCQKRSWAAAGAPGGQPAPPRHQLAAVPGGAA